MGNKRKNFIRKRLPPPHKQEDGVLFQYEAPSAKMVNLAGNFPDNQWCGTSSTDGNFDSNIGKMYDDGTHGDKVADDGIWSLLKPLDPGRYEYKYVIDRNTWVSDPNALEFKDDGYGGQNSIVIVE